MENHLTLDWDLGQVLGVLRSWKDQGVFEELKGEHSASPHVVPAFLRDLTPYVPGVAAIATPEDALTAWEYFRREVSLDQGPATPLKDTFPAWVFGECSSLSVPRKRGGAHPLFFKITEGWWRRKFAIPNSRIDITRFAYPTRREGVLRPLTQALTLPPRLPLGSFGPACSCRSKWPNLRLLFTDDYRMVFRVQIDLKTGWAVKLLDPRGLGADPATSRRAWAAALRRALWNFGVFVAERDIPASPILGSPPRHVLQGLKDADLPPLQEEAVRSLESQSWGARSARLLRASMSIRLGNSERGMPDPHMGSGVARKVLTAFSRLLPGQNWQVSSSTVLRTWSTASLEARFLSFLDRELQIPEQLAFDNDPNKPDRLLTTEFFFAP